MFDSVVGKLKYEWEIALRATYNNRVPRQSSVLSLTADQAPPLLNGSSIFDLRMNMPWFHLTFISIV